MINVNKLKHFIKIRQFFQANGEGVLKIKTFIVRFV